ncbi:HAD-IC family P-type ATPase, partial [bacterium]|nr:HAD-IC family P-type ATPase [bacterium]
EISPGLGLRGRVAGARVAVGSPAYAREIGIGAEALRASIDEAARDGESAVVVAIDGVAAGTIAVSDPPKDDAAQTVARLREMGFSVAMLTGDARPTAAAVAARLGIEDVIAEVLPDKKAERIAQLQDEGRVVAMVGDGINDAPALARADLGIALSSGTDVAIESADLAIVGPRLMTVVTSIEISRRTLSAIRQNLFFAFIYNVVGIPLAAGGFYLLTGGPLPPTFAAAAMAASSISVISNSLRLRRAFTRAPEDTGTRTAAVAGAEA